MLIRADLRTLDFSELKKVYAEGIRENGVYFYPDKTLEEQLRLSAEDFWKYLSEDYFLSQENFYWIWMENGNYISAMRLEAHEDGLLLEALETRPECRKNGYAKKLIESVLAQLPTGTKVYSHISKQNVPSLNTHRSCGFLCIKDYAVDLDGAVAENHVTMCICL